MDFQTLLDNALTASRAESLAKSDQLTLGEIILKLEPIVAKLDKDKEEPTVFFDFENLFPTGIRSWRGIYAELALSFSNDKGKKPMKATEFLAMLKETVGKTFEGYKGGDFTMSKHTPVWVANYGNSGSTAVIDILDEVYSIIIITGYRPS